MTVDIPPIVTIWSPLLGNPCQNATMDSNDTLNESLRLIDPEGMLVPGTRQHDRIREMIEIWLRLHGPEKTLEMARYSAKYLMVWWKVLQDRL